MTGVLLETRNLRRSFGGVHAVRDVSMEVPVGAIKAVIGPNGAGKTTLFNLIAGTIAPHQGEVLFRGRRITAWKPHAVASLGIARTFQTTKLFPHMTVHENVMVGRHPRTRAGFLAGLLNLPWTWREDREIRIKAAEILADLGLASYAKEMASNLPFGRQRLVEFARALATEPALLLLDEPAAGLNIYETQELSELILKIRDRGVTCLIVEHDMSLVMNISDEVLVLDQGQKIAEGPPKEIQRNPDVIRIYLGTAMLKIRNLEAGYGPLRVLKGISLHVAPGEAVAVIGANGAGKTTLLKTIAGVLRARSGEIEFDRQDILGRRAERIVGLGCCLVPEGRHVFPTMTVRENLLLGAFCRRRTNKGTDLDEGLEQVYNLFGILKERSSQLAGTLSGGQQQMLAIGRALMSRPRLLMMDEPSLGVAPLVVRDIYETIVTLKRNGLTILLVEQNARAALAVADRGYVIETGQIVLQGPSRQLSDNPEVQRAYLGKEYRSIDE